MRKAAEAKETPREVLGGSVHEARPNMRFRLLRQWRWLLPRHVLPFQREDLLHRVTAELLENFLRVLPAGRCCLCWWPWRFLQSNMHGFG